jgi:hypothetical protein
MRNAHRSLAGAAVLTTIFTAAGVGTALGHVHEDIGEYAVELGWKVEPAYVGQPNAVQVAIRDQHDQPVNDLDLDALHVVVSTGSQTSPELGFEPGFDPEELEGPLGEYDAAIVPTAPGDYTFHISGTIHGQAVDITSTSSEETFDPVIGGGDIEFPAKLPTMAEVATHLDRIDQRISTLQTGAGPTAADLQAAQAATSEARTAADRALAAASGVAIVAVAALLLAAWLFVRLRRLQRASGA